MLRTTRLGRAAVLAALAAGLALAAGGPADAFWKRDREPETAPTRAVDRHRYPRMAFWRGTLRGGGGGWSLDGTPLVLTADTRLDGVPAAGREAVVMGCRRGGAVFVHHATVLGPDRSVARGITAGRTVAGLPRPAPPSVRH